MPKLIGINRYCIPYAQTLCANPMRHTVPDTKKQRTYTENTTQKNLENTYFLVKPHFFLVKNEGLGMGPYVPGQVSAMHVTRWTEF